MTAPLFIQQPSFEKARQWADSRATALRPLQAECSRNTVPPQCHNAFPIYDATLRPVEAKRPHWSTAWSDLMMTMFILFLSLFVYQAAHEDFLSEHSREQRGTVVRATTSNAPRETPTLPFTIIKSVPPPSAGETAKKAEALALQNVSPETTFSAIDLQQSFEQLAQDLSQAASASIANTGQPPPQKSRPGQEKVNKTDTPPQTLFDKSIETVRTNDLGKLASIDLLPNKAVRIVLTSDLLFATGQAELSKAASKSLQKIATVVSESPHQIHVEGHTDDVPINAGRYANNWELSMARANAVAMFLIEDMEMHPDQFVISGYSSYKPVASNSNAAGRAQNRRVEIVVAQPPEQPATAIVDTFAGTTQTL